jgi:predicted dehydrogenase
MPSFSQDPLAADRLGAGVVGLGVGEAHAAAYAASPRAALKCVFDLDREKAEAFVASRPGVTAVSSFEEILADPAVRIVSIASYDDAHGDQILRALEAGKHVFTEKPMCRSFAELDRIRRALAVRPDLFFGVNLVLRAAPLYQWLRREIAAGTFGRIYAFDGDYIYGRLEKITDGWRGRIEDYSVMQGGGVHLVDLMLWLTGERPIAATAVGNGIATQATSFRGLDHVAAHYEFASGMIGRITANFGAVHPHQHVVRIFGTEATFLLDDRGPRLHRGRDRAPDCALIELSPLPDSKGALIPDIVERIIHGKDHVEDARHEFEVMSACFATDESLAQGGRAAVRSS